MAEIIRRCVVEISYNTNRLMDDITEFINEKEVLEFEQTDSGIYILATDGFDEDFKEFKHNDYIYIK